MTANTTIPSIRSKAMNGMLWSFFDKSFSQIVQTIIGITLARLLLPEQFGTIGMVAVFIGISQVFATSGLSLALIQKKDRTELDYATVFIFNLAISILCYAVIYIVAPIIALFYNMPELTVISRVLTIEIIINSLAIVQRTKLMVEINFKTITLINISTVIVSGAVGISLALFGFGVWALVFQSLSRAIISLVLFWSFSYWVPQLKYSKQSFLSLFKFGSRILIADVMAIIYQNIYKVSIGKAFSAADLGYYTRALSLSTIASNTIAGVFQQTTFPILATIQNDKRKLLEGYKKLLGISAFTTLPIMAFIVVLADPIVRVLLTEKWLQVVPLLQALSIAKIFTPLGSVNFAILNATGRSDLSLRSDLFKLPIIFIALIITIPISTSAMTIGIAVSAFLSSFINCYFPGKIFGYGAMKQYKDIMPIIIITIISSIVVYYGSSITENSAAKILSGVLPGIITYLGLAYIFKIQFLDEGIALIKSMLINK